MFFCFEELVKTKSLTFKMIVAYFKQIRFVNKSFYDLSSIKSNISVNIKKQNMF